MGADSGVTFGLRITGEQHEIAADPETPLIYVLRDELGLKGTKLGCGLEQCGACAVLVGGESTLSCRLPVGQVAGREITTVEGLAENGNLHPIQRAFLEEQAAQCGYCTPGILIATAALLAWNDAPSDQDIRRALNPHLCRCGVHSRVLRAVRRAARELGA